MCAYKAKRFGASLTTTWLPAAVWTVWPVGSDPGISSAMSSRMPTTLPLATE